MSDLLDVYLHEAGSTLYVTSGNKWVRNFQVFPMLTAHTGLPLAMGFGISKPEHVAALADHVEAVVVGSAIVRQIERDPAKLEASRIVADLPSLDRDDDHHPAVPDRVLKFRHRLLAARCIAAIIR